MHILLSSNGSDTNVHARVEVKQSLSAQLIIVSRMCGIRQQL